jgi:arsenate reductase (glutaredoxin)
MVINTIIWHNPKCSKSRQALRYLNQKNTNPVIRLYLKNPPTISELKKVLLLLNLRTIELTRTKEVEFKALPSNITNDDNLLIKALTQYPKLIERPIIIKGERAVLGRTTSKIEELF